ncbi:hypothetical protein cyc_04533 [Cyclospora cayetanensis]|uniref:Uncharacterized protein n=1 Tax=Cyclospora cayetanensis TaxID=88456 RepID=A0A1D3CXJ2_9EIME|nr:hypothetical protein cyc_04533 [Cyclospora cayetanensis]
MSSSAVTQALRCSGEEVTAGINASCSPPKCGESNSTGHAATKSDNGQKQAKMPLTMRWTLFCPPGRARIPPQAQTELVQKIGEYIKLPDIHEQQMSDFSSLDGAEAWDVMSQAAESAENNAAAILPLRQSSKKARSQISQSLYKDRKALH